MTPHLGPRARHEAAPDAGLQSERTAMAWQRTALVIGGVSALLLHGRTTWLGAAPGVAGMLCALALLVHTELRYERTVRRVSAGRTTTDPRMLALVSTVATLLAVSALGLAAGDLLR